MHIRKICKIGAYNAGADLENYDSKGSLLILVKICLNIVALSMPFEVL